MIIKNGIHICARSFLCEHGLTQLHGTASAGQRNMTRCCNSSRLGLSGASSHLWEKLAAKIVGSQSSEWWPEEVYPQSHEPLFLEWEEIKRQGVQGPGNPGTCHIGSYSDSVPPWVMFLFQISLNHLILYYSNMMMLISMYVSTYREIVTFRCVAWCVNVCI